jgi:hypothetical protein
VSGAICTEKRIWIAFTTRAATTAPSAMPYSMGSVSRAALSASTCAVVIAAA